MTYDLQRSTSANGTYSVVYSGSAAQYTDSSVQAGTTYYYEVRADNSTTNSAYSSYVSAAALSGVPTGLTASATSSQSISITWNSVTVATTYALQCATSSSGPWTQVYSGSTASYSNSGLQPGTTYYYEVRSGTSTGNSAYSSSVSTITYPAAPTGLTRLGNRAAVDIDHMGRDDRCRKLHITVRECIERTLGPGLLRFDRVLLEHGIAAGHELLL